jgi:APA family basic amino acid/polyamine antiporter
MAERSETRTVRESGNDAPALVRTVGLPGAVLLGLGSILGTGVFVAIGLGAGAAGPAVVLAIVLAAGLAACNGLSSAQLAAAHPVSGGTYEYGHRLIGPNVGFTAGWMFMIAKSASAATAALGCAGYLMNAIGWGADGWPAVVLAVVLVLLLGGLVLAGLRRSNALNAVVVSATVLALLAFVVALLPMVVERGDAHWRPFFAGGVGAAAEGGVKLGPFGEAGLSGLLHATALMFVAYTGYGRIATLGEEVREPARIIPLAVIVTLIATLALYALVAVAAVGSVGAGVLAESTEGAASPLAAVAEAAGKPWARLAIDIGAVAAMLGVLLNLILGLSRVLLAMGRRGEMPRSFGRLNASGTTPVAAVLVVTIVIAGLALIGDVRTTWSLSAFTVLVYYAITNAAALRLPGEARRFPRWIPALGLLGCGFIAVWVEPRTWLIGLVLIAIGLMWRLAIGCAKKQPGDSR